MATVRSVVALACVALVATSAGGVTSLPTPESSSAATAIARDTVRAAKPRPGTTQARYVSPRGSDANPGTLERPWKTIGKAMKTLVPGRTAYLRAGSYRERTDVACGTSHNTLEWNRSGRPGAPITISGYPGEGRRVVVRTKIKLNGDHLRLLDLVSARNSAFNPVDNGCTGDANVNIYGDDVVISGLEIRDSNNSGVYLKDADRANILGNWIHDNGAHPTQDHGIYYGSGSGGVIANNVIERTLGYGIHMYPRPSGQTIVHNTIVGSGNSGIILSTSGSRIVVVNNISAWNVDYGIRTDGKGCEDCWADQNVLYGNSEDYYLPEPLSVQRTIQADPLFVDRSARNYRLLARSPAVNTARGDYSRPYDFDGRSRPRGAGPDIGSYER
jgi:Right handed beta helix region